MRAIYAGTFDPITNGHMSVVKRATAIFDTVVILIAVNLAKRTLFTPAERVELIHDALAYYNINNAYPMHTDRYVVEWAEPHRHDDVLIRGIRDGEDVKTELEIAAFNRNPQIDRGGRVYIGRALETLWVPAEDSGISSSACKAMAAAGDPKLQESLCPAVLRKLRDKLGVKE